MKRIFKDKYGHWYIGWVFIGGVLGLLTVLMILLIPFAIFDYYATQSSCKAYAEQTTRETRFVDNAPYWWSCQVKTELGYIDYDKLEQIENVQLKHQTK